MATLIERLAFLQKVPTLMKATSDDETPCPGYLFEEIGKISHESVGYCQCLLEYLLERLQIQSCQVKIKVLKILLHLCGHGPPHLLTELRRNATFIQEVLAYSGPPDPIHGNAPYQKARCAAQELARLLFTDSVSPESGVSPTKASTLTTGMGSESAPRSGMQGFGYSPGRVSGGETFLDKIQKAAEVVASAVLPPSEQPGIRLQDNHYRAVLAPCGVVEVAVPACAYSMPTKSHRALALRCPGQVGGGWEENDSGHSSSHNSSQENTDASRASLAASSKSGGTTDSQSAASRESGDLSERVEAMQVGDCGQEMALTSRLTEGSKVFLTREESQHFIKECSTLNCEVVVELLCRRLQDSPQTVQMRALCALACLMSSDLLSLEQIYSVTHKRLAQVSQGTPGPVTNKATKLLRQFEALLKCQTPRHSLPSPATNSPPLPLTVGQEEHGASRTTSATATTFTSGNLLTDPDPDPGDIGPPGSFQSPNLPAEPSQTPGSHSDLRGEDLGEEPHEPRGGEPQPDLQALGDEVEGDAELHDPDPDPDLCPGPAGEGEGEGEGEVDGAVEAFVSSSSPSQAPDPAADRLSLFSGMELVNSASPPPHPHPHPSPHLSDPSSGVDVELSVALTTGSPPVSAETEGEEQTGLRGSEADAPQNSGVDDPTSITQSDGDDLGQSDQPQVSAFSFLNL
ncbi:AP-4 complex accessory subunit Tepsin isoform X2 [Engraulis encrasicolus]|uniref:AP-4 complex accessory subunit Tepsin isoform X2 n=1 Tax=Engraulis encrasicolus TaxID=184585 RepID=UPI002FD3E3F2